MKQPLSTFIRDPHIIWYGPFPCETCDNVIVRCASDQGGIQLDAADHNHNYPNFHWYEHQCAPKINGAKGGKKSKRPLTTEQAKAMAAKRNPKKSAPVKDSLTGQRPDIAARSRQKGNSNRTEAATMSIQTTTKNGYELLQGIGPRKDVNHGGTLRMVTSRSEVGKAALEAAQQWVRPVKITGKGVMKTPLLSLD